MPSGTAASDLSASSISTQADEQGAKKLSPAMLRVLQKAASRERGNVCPILGVRAAAEMNVLYALRRRGLIDGMNENGIGVPFINEAGRAAVAKAAQS